MHLSPEQVKQIYGRDVHVCTPAKCPEPGKYYVTCADGQEAALLSGPYPSHGAALMAQQKVSELAVKVQPRAAFYHFGTCRSVRPDKELGLFQRLGLLEIPE